MVVVVEGVGMLKQEQALEMAVAAQVEGKQAGFCTLALGCAAATLALWFCATLALWSCLGGCTLAFWFCTLPRFSFEADVVAAAVYALLKQESVTVDVVRVNVVVSVCDEINQYSSYLIGRNSLQQRSRSHRDR